MPRLLEARGVSMTFRTGFAGRQAKAAVKDITLAIGGELPSITAIVGESGSGKTTLTRILLGFQRPTAGSVHYDGTDLAQMDRRQRLAFRREVQAIFQDPFEVFNPFYPVDHALTTPLMRFALAPSRDDAYARIEAVLESVGLRPRETLGRYPHQLSGGQRQRVMIARVLLVEPQIILADEPVSMVDASLRSTILDSLHRLKAEAGMSLIYVTHDLTTAYQIADMVAVLYGGAIVEAGTAEAVIRAPRHPYTQALIAAIPSPDPKVSWGLDAAEPAEGPGSAVPSGGCSFAARCPHRMARCAVEEPPMVAIEEGRVARCFLYGGQDSPAMPAAAGGAP